MHLLVMAKAPASGQVKTRLCPPLTFDQAAEYAEAALADTLDAVLGCGADEMVLALDGTPGSWLPSGFRVVPQRGITFNERLSCAWSDAGGPGLQIGMDTPHVQPAMLDAALARVMPGRALLGFTTDGGWWALGLAAPDARVFDGVPMSLPDTGARQRTQLARSGYAVDELEMLVDVDDIDDARAVADVAPDLRSTRVLRAMGALLPGIETASAHTPSAGRPITLIDHD